VNTDAGCIFCRIVRGELPCKKAYEDEHILAFHDIHPVAPMHILVIPKIHVASLLDCDETHADVLGRLLGAIGRIAKEHGASDGFRTIINTGRLGGQEVYHLHAHILAAPERLPRMLSRE
jgi:histidine triad (HIT) family protein